MLMSPQGPPDVRSRVVAFALFMHMNKDGRCYVGQARIAERCGCSLRSVRRHIKLLEDTGWLTKEVTRNEKGWRRNNYTVSLPPQLATTRTDTPLDNPAANDWPQAEQSQGSPQVSEGPNHSPLRPNDTSDRPANDLITSGSEQGNKQLIRNSIRSITTDMRMPSPQQRSVRVAGSFADVVDHVQRAIDRGIPADDPQQLSRLCGLTVPQVEAALDQINARMRVDQRMRDYG